MTTLPSFYLVAAGTYMQDGALAPGSGCATSLAWAASLRTWILAPDMGDRTSSSHEPVVEMYQRFSTSERRVFLIIYAAIITEYWMKFWRSLSAGELDILNAGYVAAYLRFLDKLDDPRMIRQSTEMEICISECYLIMSEVEIPRCAHLRQQATEAAFLYLPDTNLLIQPDLSTGVSREVKRVPDLIKRIVYTAASRLPEEEQLAFVLPFLPDLYEYEIRQEIQPEPKAMAMMELAFSLSRYLMTEDKVDAFALLDPPPLGEKTGILIDYIKASMTYFRPQPDVS